MGTSVLSVNAHGPVGFSAYAHCSKGASGGYTLLLVNFAGDDVTLTLPKHGTRTEYTAPVVMLAGRVTIANFTAHASRRVVGQWGGAGGASCEDHIALVWACRAAR